MGRKFPVRIIIPIADDTETVNNPSTTLMIASAIIELTSVAPTHLAKVSVLYPGQLDNAEIALDLQKVAHTDRGGNEVTIEFRSTQAGSFSILR